MRQALERAADRIGDRFKGQPLQEAAVRETIGDALRGVGEFAQSIRHLQSAYEVRRAKLGPDDPKTLSSMESLASSYLESGKWEQALPLAEEVLKRRKAKLGPDHYDTLVAMNHLAWAHDMAGKHDQAVSLLEETVKLLKAKLGPDHPETRQTLADLADLPARQGKWKEAADSFASLIQRDPTDHLNHHRLAALLVASGQLGVYREHCRQSAERFGKTSDPIIAERIAKDCLILPDSGADLGVVAQMADTAAAATNHSATPWFRLVKGLAEHRQGRFASAVEWVNRTLTETGKVLERDVQACMVLAMAQYRLQQTDEARAALAKGVEIERTKLPQLESGVVGGNWLDWIIAHALRREAQALIEDASTTAADTK